MIRGLASENQYIYKRAPRTNAQKFNYRPNGAHLLRN